MPHHLDNDLAINPFEFLHEESVSVSVCASGSSDVCSQFITWPNFFCADNTIICKNKGSGSKQTECGIDMNFKLIVKVVTYAELREMH